MEKVLIIAYDLNPELGSEGGVAHTYLRIYLEHFKVDAFTYSIHKQYIMNFDYGQNVTFKYVKFTFWDGVLWRLKLDIISNWFFCKRIIRYLKNNDPGQYKFVHVVTPEGFFAFNNLYKTGVKYVVGPINGGLKTPEAFRKFFMKNAIYEVLRNKAYKMVVKLPGWNKYYKSSNTIIISDANLLNLIPKKFHDKAFQIFDVLVDPNEFEPSERSKIKNNQVSVLFCGRLIPKKGIQLLLEAFKKCVNEYKAENLILNIVGKGPLLQEILKFKEENNFQDRVSVFSNIPKAVLIEKYQSADIYCLPTLREPGGLAILEAMSCGLPVITSNYGGPAFSVTSDCGIKINLNNYYQYIDDLTKAIIKLYENAPLRQEMGINSRNRILQEFSIESVERKLKILWKGLEDKNIEPLVSLQVSDKVPNA